MLTCCSLLLDYKVTKNGYQQVGTHQSYLEDGEQIEVLPGLWVNRIDLFILGVSIYCIPLSRRCIEILKETRKIFY